MHLLMRIGAGAALAGGGLRLISHFIPYVPDNAPLELLYGIIDIGLLLGLVALAAATSARIAAPGLVMLLAAIAGVASIVGPDRIVFGIDFYLAGGALFSLALGGASVWLVRLPAYRRPSVAFALSALLALGSGLGASSAMIAGAGLALALGFVLLAPALWREAAASQDRAR